MKFFLGAACFVLAAIVLAATSQQQVESQESAESQKGAAHPGFFRRGFPLTSDNTPRTKREVKSDSEVAEAESQEVADSNGVSQYGGFFRNLDNPKSREKRQIMELISGLTSGGGGEGSSLSNLIPGFSEYGPAFMSLINNFLGFMKCCGPVLIPEVVMKLVMKCSDDLTNKFFADSGFLNRTELDKKTTIFLKSPSLSGFFEAEFLSKEGLPNTVEAKKIMPRIVGAENMKLLGPAFDECEKGYMAEYALYKASGKQLTDSDRCWGSAAFVECMYRQIIQVCPEEQIQAGSLCLQKMGNFFWNEMPKQVGRFFSVIKNMVDIL